MHTPCERLWVGILKGRYINFDWLIDTYICLYSEVCLSSRGFCLESFVRGGFFPSHLLSEYIRYNRKLNITFNFRFHKYETNFEKCDVPYSWTSPCHKLSYLLGPPPPLERDVLYGRSHDQAEYVFPEHFTYVSADTQETSSGIIFLMSRLHSKLSGA